MKIYHKKNFASGVFALSLGVLNLVRSAWQGFEWNDGALVALLLFLGGACVIRSLSPRWSQEDKVEERDERNQLVKLKSKSRAYSISQIAFLAAELVLIALGKIRGQEILIYMGLGLMAAFFISLLTDFFTWVYYDEHT
ncbi:hypothetical protein AALC17_03895 [Oscillospiraceae bacterium 38-13]